MGFIIYNTYNLWINIERVKNKNIAQLYLNLILIIIYVIKIRFFNLMKYESYSQVISRLLYINSIELNEKR